MNVEGVESRFDTEAIHILYVNFWPRGRARLDRTVRQLGAELTVVNADAPDAAFSTPTPDVILVGFSAHTRQAATFIANFKSSPWFRRVPLLALIDSRNEGQLWMCMEWGCDDAMMKPVRGAQLRARVHRWVLRHRMRERERREAHKAILYSQRAAAFAEIIVPLGVAMMAETDFEVLLETILKEAQRYSNADGGTLYLLSDRDTLDFKIVINDSMGILYHESDRESLPFNPEALPLNGEKAKRHIASHVARTGETVSIEDAYGDTWFDVSGAHAFDKQTGYTTTSLLTIALRDRQGGVIGVLQLINAMDRETGEVIPFDPIDQAFIESLSRLAGQALDSYQRMARLRRDADALVININEDEKKRQVEAIASSEYFKTLKERAHALRDTPEPAESASTQ